MKVMLRVYLCQASRPTSSKCITIPRVGEFRGKPLWRWRKKSIREVIWQNLCKATYTAETPCPAFFQVLYVKSTGSL